MEFYYVNLNYANYLQAYEKKIRGFTRVPNILYKGCSKFVFGVVLKIGQFNYYVPVSSYKIKQESNILIKIEADSEKIKGTLRFNYMFPVPDNCLTKIDIKEIKDKKYRSLVNKEFEFCMNNIFKIKKKAELVYKLVTKDKKKTLVVNSCDFKVLESAYLEYITKT